MSCVPGSISRKIRIAQVITGLVLGGGGQVVWTIARKIDRTQFEMDVYCVIEGGDLVDDIEQMGFKVKVLERVYDHRRLLPYDLMKILELARDLKKGQYDIVHTHLYQADVIGRIAGILAGVPRMVKSLHNMGEWKTAWHLTVDRLLLTKTDKVICCSEHQKEAAIRQEGLSAKQVTTIYNGVDLKRFESFQNRLHYASSLKLDLTCRIVGTVGRMIEAKGQKYLLQAIPLILANHPSTQFLLIGDGPLRKELEGLVKNTFYEDQVFFVGLRKDIPQLLGLMDVFVFPSLSEGFSIALLEAMAARLPVIASDIRPLSEAVVHEETGFLVEPRSPRAIACAVNKLLDNEDLRLRMGESGRERVARYFTDDIMVKKTEEIYTQLAASSDSGKSTC